jgi:hypothetical protein
MKSAASVGGNQRNGENISGVNGSSNKAEKRSIRRKLKVHLGINGESASKAYQWHQRAWHLA